jgi:hypothetical protein
MKRSNRHFLRVMLSRLISSVNHTTVRHKFSIPARHSMATGRWARGLHRNTDACPPGPRRCEANNCCADPRYDTARTAAKCMKLHVPTSDGPGQSKHQPQQGRWRRILGALYHGCPRVARPIVYANQRRAPAGGTVPQINLIEVAPTRPTRYLGLETVARPGRKCLTPTKIARDSNPAPHQQLVLGALKGPAATNSLSNVTRHYDDLSQASVRLGQPVLAPT